jgi:hypothetical protein
MARSRFHDVSIGAAGDHEKDCQSVAQCRFSISDQFAGTAN